MMQIKLNWQKKLFSNQYTLYSADQLVGKLKNRLFSQTADAELNEKKYIFKTTGFLQQTTEITDLATQKVLGEIKYTSFRTRATITAGNTIIHWKFDNTWNSKWSMNGPDGTQIFGSVSTTNGQISSNTTDELLLLSGLYINDFYNHTTIAVMIAIFVPIFASTFH